MILTPCAPRSFRQSLIAVLFKDPIITKFASNALRQSHCYRSHLNPLLPVQPWQSFSAIYKLSPVPLANLFVALSDPTTSPLCVTVRSLKICLFPHAASTKASLHTVIIDLSAHYSSASDIIWLQSTSFLLGSVPFHLFPSQFGTIISLINLTDQLFYNRSFSIVQHFPQSLSTGFYHSLLRPFALPRNAQEISFVRRLSLGLCRSDVTFFLFIIFALLFVLPV